MELAEIPALVTESILRCGLHSCLFLVFPLTLTRSLAVLRCEGTQNTGWWVTETWLEIPAQPPENCDDGQVT